MGFKELSHFLSGSLQKAWETKGAGLSVPWRASSKVGKNKQHALQSHFILHVVLRQGALKWGASGEARALSGGCGPAVRVKGENPPDSPLTPLLPPASSSLQSRSLLLGDIHFLCDSRLRTDLIPGTLHLNRPFLKMKRLQRSDSLMVEFQVVSRGGFFFSFLFLSQRSDW